MTPHIAETPLPVAAGDVLDVAPVPSVPAAWILVTPDGRLLRFEAGRREVNELGVIALPKEPEHQVWAGHELTPRLHVSARGEFVAVVNDYGKHGLVYDTREKAITLEMQSGDYYTQTVPFSFCFVEHEGSTVAIHRTDWNRLDASDAASGALITDRAPTSYQDDEEMPEHYLDYFHGRLLLSPGSIRIANDGWMWHPLGEPYTWEVRPWLKDNVWESEDGPSKLPICARSSYWDHPMCWLDDARIAVSGIGENGHRMADGVRVFSVVEPTDVTTNYLRGRAASEVATFEGPVGQLFSDGLRLFSTESNGLAIWDVELALRIAEVDDFFPTRQHAASYELAEVRDGVLRRWGY